MTQYYKTNSSFFKGFLCLMLAFFTLHLSGQCGDRFLEPVFATDDITVTQDIPYGEATAIPDNLFELKFDFYEPNQDLDPMEARPLIIWAHGGFFAFGNEDDMGFIAQDFAEKGYACASINYRLIDLLYAAGNQDIIDELFVDEITRAVSDMRAAIRHFRADADNENNFRIDPNQIFVGGISAGGVLAAHVGYLTDDQGLDQYTTVDIGSYIEQNGGYEGNTNDETLGYSSHVSGIISLSGALGDTSFMQAGEVPIISVHDDNDQVVPYDADMVVLGFGGITVPIAPMMGSELVHAQAQELGISSALLTYENSDGHVAYFDTPENAAQTDSFVTVNLAPLVDCTMDYAISYVEAGTCFQDGIPDDTVLVSGILQDTQFVISYTTLPEEMIYISGQADEYSIDTILYTNQHGCDSIVVEEYFTTALESLPNMSIKVYPNPANDVFTLELSGEQTEKVGLRLFDLTGKLVEEYTTVSNQLIRFDVSHLTAGIYTLLVDTEQGSVYKKVVLY